MLFNSIFHFSCFSYFLMTTYILFLVDFVIPQKGESLLGAYDKWRKWADEKGKVYSNHTSLNCDGDL